MHRVALFLLAGLALAAPPSAGCLGRSPRPDYYRLRPLAADTAPVAALPELGIAIGAIEFPRYLDRPEMIVRDGAYRLVPADTARWGGSLQSEVRRVFADDLAALLGTSRVAVYPVEPRFPVDYRVLVDVRSFEGVVGEGVSLRARWIVAAGGDGRALAVEESRIEQPAASATWEAHAAAHSDALEALARAIATRIAALAAP